MSLPMETAVLDAAEFIGERSALPMDELGLDIVDSEWGDAQQEVFYIRQELGEIPAERHPPNRTVVLKLHAKKEGSVSLAEAAQKLQKKVGILQKEGGWIKRIFSANARASVDVGFEVYSAVLSGLQGWYMAHRAFANEITLTLTCSPYCYGTAELEGATVTSTNNRDKEWEIAAVKGTAPGLLRLKVKNLGTVDWNGFIGSIESKDHVAGANALLGYKCTELTFPGSTESTKTPPAGNKTVKRLLTSTWQTILSGKITATALDMAHVGGRRLLIRLFNEAALPTGNRLRLEWRSLGNSWQVNEEVEITVLGSWVIIDLGEAILERAVFGEQAWEWHLQGRNAAGETTGTVYLDKIYPLAQEQYFSFRKAYAIRPPTAYQINGEPKEGTVGLSITGKAVLIGGKWETSGSALAEADWLRAAAGSVALRNKGKETEPRLALVSTPTATNMQINSSWLYTALVGAPLGFQREYGVCAMGGAVQALVYPVLLSGGTFTLHLELRGTNIELFQSTVISANTSHVNNIHELSLTILGKKAIAVYTNPLIGRVELTSPLIASEAGKLGMLDSNNVAGGSIECKSFTVAEAEGENLLHEKRLMNISSNGVFNQHETKERWGEVPLHDGFLPYAAPSYLEGRPLRGILIPSQGDLEAFPDTGVNEFEVTPFYRPAYHFMSEATP